MALTQIVDSLPPEVWNAYVTENSVEMNVFVRSGVITVGNPVLQGLLNGGGNTTNVPFWKDLTQTDIAAPTSDDPGSLLTAKKITSDKQVAVRLARAQAWAAADLVSEIAGSDPMIRIASRVGNYWNGQLTRKLLSIILGIDADSVASHQGDLIEDISVQTTPDATNLIHAEAVIDAKQTMGDHSGSLVAMAMHSVPFSRLQKNNLIDFIVDGVNENAVRIPFYNGLAVVVDDILLPDTSDTEDVYSTYLFGTGAFAYATGSARVPVEVEREALQGDGGGVETLVSRVSDSLHPFGYKYTSLSVAGETPTNAELDGAGDWDRVIDRQLVPFAILKSNG